MKIGAGAQALQPPASLQLEDLLPPVLAQWPSAFVYGFRLFNVVPETTARFSRSGDRSRNRMNHGLMTPESPADLGFDEENDRALSAVNERDDGKEQLKVSDGAYVAGLRYHRSRRRHREQEGQRPGSPREESPEG
jgi:hypothetical protein